jgi:hypothetical protein
MPGLVQVDDHGRGEVDQDALPTTEIFINLFSIHFQPNGLERNAIDDFELGEPMEIMPEMYWR